MAAQLHPRNVWLEGSSCYFDMDEPTSWVDADNICTTAGGHLVMVDNQDENDFLYFYASRDRWLGYNDRDHYRGYSRCEPQYVERSVRSHHYYVPQRTYRSYNYAPRSSRSCERRSCAATTRWTRG